jgi:hypothetical protein
MQAAKLARTKIPMPPTGSGINTVVSAYITKVTECQTAVERAASMVEDELAAALADTTSALKVSRMQVIHARCCWSVRTSARRVSQSVVVVVAVLGRVVSSTACATSCESWEPTMQTRTARSRLLMYVPLLLRHNCPLVTRVPLRSPRVSAQAAIVAAEGLAARVSSHVPSLDLVQRFAQSTEAARVAVEVANLAFKELVARVKAEQARNLQAAVDDAMATIARLSDTLAQWNAVVMKYVCGTQRPLLLWRAWLCG